MAHIKSLAPVNPKRRVDLKDYNPASQAQLPEEATVKTLIEQHTQEIGRFQELLYADGSKALLVILQGMDAAGKDGTVGKVFDHVNPMGMHVASFKSPSAVERDHDFLWRIHQAVPPLGCIGIFNRSHYEDVLVVRVHADQLLPPHLRHARHLWKRRYRRINDFERLLADNGIVILKFFLHISRQEQRRRFVERQKNPEKHWKLAASDFQERKFWPDYQHAYEQMLRHTSTPQAPWYIIPADHKWVRDYHVARIVHDTLAAMKPRPRPATDPRLITMRFT